MYFNQYIKSVRSEQIAPKCILVVDDELLIRWMASEALRDAGFNVIEAATADEALQLIVPFSPDLILSDVHMPGSMNGLEMLSKLRDNYPTLPVIISTGHIRQSEVPSDDFTFYLPKPAGCNGLITIIENTIGPAV